MLEICHRNTLFWFSFMPKCIRSISEFRIPKTDCTWKRPVKRVVNTGECLPRDQGLVLGIYRNDDVPTEPAILTAAAEKYDRDNGGKLWKLLKLSPIPRLGETRVFFDVDPKFGYVAVAGLGSECLTYDPLEQREEHIEAIRVAAGVGTRAIQQLRPSAIHVESFGDAEASAEGSALATWQFAEYRAKNSPARLARPVLYLYDDCDEEGWSVGKLKGESQNLARYLQEMPANLLNPTSFAKLAVDLLCELDINVEVKTQGWASSHEMGGFVAIGKSSVQPPLYVEIEYFGGDVRSRPVVLVGKGVTFDSGSLSLKCMNDLRYMRGDMAGAAVVLAAVRAAALLKLPINIRGILPLCELMPNGSSPHFGDVVCSASGKSVRIRMPAHEGRLMIADSLIYARNYWPKFILDVGTMSKELIHTLGGAACACYTNSDELLKYATAAGARSGDRMWHMPLWRDFENRISNLELADVANSARLPPTPPAGDSACCAAFLKQFVCDSRWIHLDTYNVSYTKGQYKPYLRRGMTGRPTRTILQMLQNMTADCKI